MIHLAIKESGKEWVLLVQGREFGSSKNRFDVDHAYNILKNVLVAEGVPIHDARDRVGTMPAILGAPYGPYCLQPIATDFPGEWTTCALNKGHLGEHKPHEQLIKEFWDRTYREQEKP